MKGSESRFRSVPEVLIGSVALLVALVATWRVAAPTIRPDEWGYLLNGQVLLGRSEPLLPYARYYGPVYGLVTAFGALITGSLHGAFRFALLFNLATVMVTGLGVRRLASRWGADRANAAMIALVVMVAPGSLASAMFSWAEPLVRLLVVLVVLCAVEVERGAGPGWFALFVTIAGMAPMLHGRLVAVTAGALLVLVLWYRRRLLGRSRIVTGVASVISLYAVGRAFAFVLRRWLYRNRATQEGRLFELLRNPSHFTDLIRESAGQGWYLLASTLGLALVGFVVVARRARGNGVRAAQGDTGAILTVVLTMSFLFLGAVQLVEATRGDQFVYGRYVETASPVLLVAALASLSHGASILRRTWGVAVVSILCLPVVMTIVLGQDIVRQWSRFNGPLRSPNIPALDGVQSLVGSSGLVVFAVAFASLSAGAFVVSYAGSRIFMRSLAVVFLLSSSWTSLHTMSTRNAKWEGLGSSFAAVGRSESTVVGYDDRTVADKRYYVIRYRLHPTRIVWMPVSRAGSVVPAGINCVYGFEDGRPADGAWTIAGREDSVGLVLWRRAGAARC